MSDTAVSPKLRVLVFAASLRKESMNRKLAALAARVAQAAGATVDLASLQEFDVPLYNGDLEASQGIPQGAYDFQRRLLASDAFIRLS
jgi:NAD(P)H-dependent FMN reductase